MVSWGGSCCGTILLYGYYGVDEGGSGLRGRGPGMLDVWGLGI